MWNNVFVVVKDLCSGAELTRTVVHAVLVSSDVVPVSWSGQYGCGCAGVGSRLWALRHQLRGKEKNISVYWRLNKLFSRWSIFSHWLCDFSPSPAGLSCAALQWPVWRSGPSGRSALLLWSGRCRVLHHCHTSCTQQQPRVKRQHRAVVTTVLRSRPSIGDVNNSSNDTTITTVSINVVSVRLVHSYTKLKKKR